MVKRETKRKVTLLGETGVGKTSLSLRFVKDVFGEKYLKTIGTNVYSKKIPITGSEVKLLIYDIMGDTGFDSVRERAFDQSTGAVAVADITREETLYKLTEEWVPKFRNSAVDNAPIVLAINKVDLENQEFTREEIVDNVMHYFDSIFFTSAKTGENVEDLFKELGFRSIYHQSLAVKEGKYIGPIDNPKELLSVLLTYASELGDMPYSTREKIFETSGMDKFSLDEGFSEEEVLSFGNGLIQWYEENEDDESASEIRSVLEKYQQGE